MLKAKVSGEEFNKLTELEKANYIQMQDGFYMLQVEQSDGFALENITGLKKTVETLRAMEKTLKEELKHLKETYEGIDPEAAKNALNKYDEIKSWNADEKTKEVIANNKRELVKQHEIEIGKAKTELDDTRNQLHEAIVTTKIVEALQTAQGNVELLTPHVKRFVRMTKGADGKFYPEVINDNGEPRIGDSKGSPMTIPQLIEEMKSNRVYAPAFVGANSSGSGNAASGSSASKSTSTVVKVIAASDSQGLSSSIEDIAAGKAVVDMRK